jgi:hypothetical protein
MKHCADTLMLQVHNWARTFCVALGSKCRTKRKVKAGESWNVARTTDKQPSPIYNANKTIYTILIK